MDRAQKDYRPAWFGASIRALDRAKTEWLPRVGIRVVVGIVVSLLATGLFAWTWDQVNESDAFVIMIDRSLSTWMHGRQSQTFTSFARVLAATGAIPFVTVIGCISAAIGLFRYRMRAAAWTMAIAIAGAGVLTLAAKLIFHRPRPTFFAHMVQAAGYSFPSGHSLFAVVVYGLLGYFALRAVRGRLTKFLIVVSAAALILLTGMSRVYVAVHYPTDVLAGWAAGIPWLIACFAVHTALVRRRDDSMRGT